MFPFSLPFQLLNNIQTFRFHFHFPNSPSSRHFQAEIHRHHHCLLRVPLYPRSFHRSEKKITNPIPGHHPHLVPWPSKTAASTLFFTDPVIGGFHFCSAVRTTGSDFIYFAR
ncbi:unnamed protein product [Linum trigynum]|uniref:Uncharacterized protein n=1 Tax=Linum trigynum TaxID=586398 RepID=A0AAV2EU99_9ROSI